MVSNILQAQVQLPTPSEQGAKPDKVLNVRQIPGSASIKAAEPQTGAIPSARSLDVPPTRICGTQESEKTRGLVRAGQVEASQDFENWLDESARKATATRSARTAGAVVYSLPIVVHVIYSSEIENISEAQVQSQIDVLNQDYRRRNPDRSLTPNNFSVQSADIELEFCLAKVSPDGKPSVGIDRISIPGSPFSESYINEVIKPSTIWDPNRYMNIWVCHINKNMLGFAQFPVSDRLAGIPVSTNAAQTDGVAISCYAFGLGGITAAPFNQGRTTTHEVGHWLGLRHIWGDGACEADDFCDDTPMTGGPFFACPPPSVLACDGGPAMATNFMDYADDGCMNLFTQDQKIRIRTVLENSPRRRELLESDVCQRALPPPQPEFVADIATGCSPFTVNFKATNVPAGATLVWSFPGGRPATSADPEPKVAYRTAGVFPVSLRYYAPGGNPSNTKENFITVVDKGLALPFDANLSGRGLPSGFSSRQGAFTWSETPATDAFGGTGTSLMAQPANGFGPAWLISPLLDLTTASELILQFDLAYGYNGTFPSDSLGIFVATDCSPEFHNIYFKGGNQLSTARTSPEAPFLPTPSQWRTEKIDLRSFQGNQRAQIAFLYYGAGSNVFIDNIRMGNNPPIAPNARFRTPQEQICAGSTIQFQDQSEHRPAKWLWSFPGGIPASDTTANPVVRYPTPGIYDVSLTVVNEAGQSTLTRNELLLVQAGPDMKLEASRTDLCLGEETTLRVTGLDEIQWSLNGTPMAFTDSVLKVSPRSDAIYEVTGSAGQACKAQAQITIRVRQGRDLAIVPLQPTICRGDSIALTAVGADNYLWNPRDGLTIAQGGYTVARPLKTTTYTVIGTRSSGCTLTQTVTVTVSDAPPITVSPAQPVVCAGENLALSVQGASSYEWMPSPSINTTRGGEVWVNPKTTTSYELIATSAEGCKTYRKVEVRVNPLPTLSLKLFPDEPCKGTLVEMLASGAKRYSWLANDPIEASFTGTAKLEAQQSTTIRVIGENEFGCRDTVKADLYVKPGPAVSISNLHPTVCPGQSTQLVATGASLFRWVRNPDITSVIGNIVEVRPTTRGTYRVYGQDEEGCETFAETQVNVMQAGLPVPEFRMSAQEVCTGREIDIQDLTQNATDYYWEFPGAEPAFSRDPSPKIKYNTPGVYDILLTVRNCNGEKRLQRQGWVVVRAGGKITLNTSDVTVCRDEPFRLVATGGESYEWSPAIGLSNTKGATVTATPPKRTTYTVTGTDRDGCLATASVTLGVTGNGRQLALLPFNPVICEGSNVILQAKGAATYNWFPQRGLSAYAGSEVIAFPDETTTYTVESVDFDGCIFRDTIRVIVEKSLPLTISPASVTICEGEALSLSVAGEGFFNWTIPGTSLNVAGSQYIATPKTTTTYQVNGLRGNGCPVTGTATVTVIPKPELVVKAQSEKVCPGEGVLLTATSNMPITWSPGLGLDKTSGNLVTASPAKTTTFVASTGAGNCIVNQTVTLEVISPKALEVTPALSRICPGAKVELSASGAVSYSWKNTEGLSNVSGNKVVARPGVTTRYEVFGKDAQGCEVSGFASVVVESQHFAAITASRAVACKGKPMELVASGGARYQWIGPDNHPLPNQGTNLIVDNEAAGAYRMVATNDLGCADTAAVKVEFRDLKPLFSASPEYLDLALAPGVVGFRDLTEKATSWQWDFEDGSQSRESSPTHVFYQPGTYQITLRVSDGVCEQEVEKTIQVINSSNLAELEAANGIAVNDLNQDGTVGFSIDSDHPMHLLMSLKDQAGKTLLDGVLRIPKGGYTQQLNLKDFESGSYTLNFSDGKQLVAYPLMLP